MNSKANRKKLVTSVLSFVFFLEGMMFYNHYSYAYHVGQAENSVERLENILEGNVSDKPLGASLLGIYEPKNDFGDIELRNLTKKIVSSTERAIKNADDITHVGKLKKAVDEIGEIQEKGVNIIQNTLEKIETDDINREVKTIYVKAVGLKEKVDEAKTFIQAAIDNNQEFIEIDIINDKDDSHEEGHQEENEEDEDHGLNDVFQNNPNLRRIEQQKIEDAKQREENRKRIRLIEEGREAQKAQKQKNKLSEN